MQLGYMYPGNDNNWIVRSRGTFYRNYQSDVMSVDENYNIADLARDGFLHLLPQGIITSDYDLNTDDPYQKKAAWNELQARKRRLDSAFLPIDTIRFRNRMLVEKNIAELVSEKQAILLKTVYGINVEDYPNPFIQHMIHILPNIKRYRGDLNSIRCFLENSTESEVELIRKRYSDTDSTRQWLVEAIYNIYIDNLSSVEYQEMTEKVEQIEDFLREWLVPIEVKLRVKIKMRTKTKTIGSSFIMDYNIQL